MIKEKTQTEAQGLANMSSLASRHLGHNQGLRSQNPLFLFPDIVLFFTLVLVLTPNTGLVHGDGAATDAATVLQYGLRYPETAAGRRNVSGVNVASVCVVFV